MTGPIPYGLHVISGELTEKDTDRILSAIHRFLTYKEAAQLENLKQVYDLPDGGYFIVQHVGGLFRVIADKQEPEKFKFANDGLVKMYVPIFFSGVVEKTQVRVGEKVKLKVTDQCRRRLERLIDTTIPKDLELERFVVEQSLKFPEFVADYNPEIIRTQYQAQNHAWYTGTMAKLMQFVGGYGRQDFDQLPDNPIERCYFPIPEKLFIELHDKYKDVRLPGYRGLPPGNGQFQYDYKWIKTEAVAFDDLQRPWLIRVGSRVWAMPLPIIPITADPLFHEYAQELGDPELLKVLETFGAMPSGEGFPEDGNDFQRWKRAGVIIEICENWEFLSHRALFEACGWSFHSEGHSAYNTGYTFDQKGIIECSTFKLRLELFSTEHHYGTDKIDAQSGDLNAAEQSVLVSYMSKLYSQMEGEDSLLNSIKYKLRHIDQMEIVNRAGSSFDIETELNYWDQYVCEPIAKHKGRINKIYTGKLYHPNAYRNQPQIKFPVYQVGLCVSFDFTPLERDVWANCDTIMYAYYDDQDNLKVVKYFYHHSTFEKEVDTDFEDFMTVGSWYRTAKNGEAHISGHFYTTDLDDREEVAESIEHTTIEGEDKGYDSKPYFGVPFMFSMQGEMWRNRYYTHLAKTRSEGGRSVTLAIVVPFYNTRNILYANRVYSEVVNEYESLKLLSVKDPYIYRYWTYHPVMAWFNPLSKQTGVPVPKYGNPVWVEIEEYHPTETSDFADNGPWIPSLPVDYSWLIWPDGDRWSDAGGPPKVNEYSTVKTTTNDTKGFLKWVVNDRIFTLKTIVPEEAYFKVSPGELDTGLSRSGSKVSFGEVNYVNISEVDANGIRKFTGYTGLVDHKRTFHFIGVINE